MYDRATTREEFVEREGHDPVDRAGWWSFRAEFDDDDTPFYVRACFLDDGEDHPHERRDGYVWAYSWEEPLAGLEKFETHEHQAQVRPNADGRFEVGPVLRGGESATVRAYRRSFEGIKEARREARHLTERMDAETFTVAGRIRRLATALAGAA